MFESRVKMNNLKMLINVDLVLSAICLAALVFSHLALTDIYHGDENLSLEWNILRMAALANLSFIAVTIFTLLKARKRLSL